MNEQQVLQVRVFASNSTPGEWCVLITELSTDPSAREPAVHEICRAAFTGAKAHEMAVNYATHLGEKGR